MKVEVPAQRKIIDYYGAEKQSIIHMEECAELIQAISKVRRTIDAGIIPSEVYENLVEEMADVLIVLEQLQELYEIPNHMLQSEVLRKTARQEARIHGDV